MQEALIDECVVTRLATCVPVVTSPLPVVRATQFSWRTHKRLRGDAEGPLSAAFCRTRAGVGGPVAVLQPPDLSGTKLSFTRRPS